MLDQVLEAFRRPTGSRFGPDAARADAVPVHFANSGGPRAGAARTSSPQHGDRSGRHHHHFLRRAGGVLCAHSGSARRGRAAHRRFAPAFSRRNESRADIAPHHLHFAATEQAAENLRARGRGARSITVTGNTGIDAVLYVRDGLEQGTLHGRRLPELDPSKKLIVVTAHRRESFGADSSAFAARWRRSRIRPDVQLVYPVHPNPNVQDPVQRYLDRPPNIRLIEPQELCAVRRPDAPGVSADYRFGRDSGRRAVAGQADPGVAGKDRAAGSGVGGHGEAGGHRRSRIVNEATALIEHGAY